MLIQPVLTPLRKYRVWPYKTKINIYWPYYYHSHRNMNLMHKKKHLKPTNVLYCKKTPDFPLKHTRISIHFLSKNFMLVNAMKIQTYGNQFLLAFRVALPAHVLADNIWWFLNHCFQYGAGCPVVGSFVRLPTFMDTTLFIAIAPACVNGLIWKIAVQTSVG